MLYTVVLAVGLIATATSMVAIALNLLEQRVSNRYSDIRNWEIDENRRKLAQWVYQFLAVSIFMGLFFTCFWFFYLHSATETQSFYKAFSAAPPILVFISLVSIGYIATFLGCCSWHLYSISRGFRAAGSDRFRDKLRAHTRLARLQLLETCKPQAQLMDDERAQQAQENAA